MGVNGLQRVFAVLLILSCETVARTIVASLLRMGVSARSLHDTAFHGCFEVLPQSSEILADSNIKLAFISGYASGLDGGVSSMGLVTV